MPFPLGQLALVIHLGIRDLAQIPAAILFVPEHGEPKTLHVMSCLRIDALHIPQEEILQHSLVELLWMLVDSFASHCEDCARLKAD